MKIGFVSDGKGKFYLDESNTSNMGVMKTGWQKVNNYSRGSYKAKVS